MLPPSRASWGQTSGSPWLRRLGVAATLAFALGWLPYRLYASSGLARYLKLRAERDGLRAANVKLHEENKRLRAELESLEETPGAEAPGLAAIERAARDELGLIRPGEVVFRIETGRAAAAAAGAAPREPRDREGGER